MFDASVFILVHSLKKKEVLVRCIPEIFLITLCVKYLRTRGNFTKIILFLLGKSRKKSILTKSEQEI